MSRLLKNLLCVFIKMRELSEHFRKVRIYRQSKMHNFHVRLFKSLLAQPQLKFKENNIAYSFQTENVSF